MIRDLGIGVVRVFLLWESFQPRPDAVEASALRDLAIVGDLALDAGLQLEPTFFTGHMSGPNWAPDWLLDVRGQSEPAAAIVNLARPESAAHDVLDLYATPFVLDAERLLLRTVCGALRDHPAIWAWSLGNEPDLFCSTGDGGGRTGVDGRHDRTSMTSTRPIRSSSACMRRRSTRTSACASTTRPRRPTSRSCMATRSTTRSPESRSTPTSSHSPAALTAALAGRPILFEELGVNTHAPDWPSHWEELATWDGGARAAYFASEHDAADYYAAAPERLHRIGALGAFAWCFPRLRTPSSGTARRATSRSTNASSGCIERTGRSSRWVTPCGASRRPHRRCRRPGPSSWE